MGRPGRPARILQPGSPYGEAFPPVSTRDQARAQWALLDALGIGRLALVAGGSLGGMVALEVALERPGAVGSVLPIAAPAATGALAIAWNGIQLELVRRLGPDGLDLARRLAMTTYRSEPDFEHRFGRATEPDGTPSITSYLAYQGRKLVARFDPETYRVLVGAMDRHDAGAGRGGLGLALARLADHGVRVTGLGIEGDILYGPAQVRALTAAAAAEGAHARYVELRSTKGHDAFLVEWDQLTEVVGGRPRRGTGAPTGPAAAPLRGWPDPPGGSFGTVCPSRPGRAAPESPACLTGTVAPV